MYKTSNAQISTSLISSTSCPNNKTSEDHIQIHRFYSDTDDYQICEYSQIYESTTTQYDEILPQDNNYDYIPMNRNVLL